MTKPSFTAQLRAIDDANLDPYQFRMVMHFWRVGKCFESLRTTAEKCGMSLGKASKVKQWLLDNGWVELVPYGGKMAVQLCSLSEHCSPHEQERSPHEQVQPVNVHHVNAILNEPLLNEPLLNDEDGSPIYVLCEHFKNLTGIFYNSNTPTFERDWKEPLTTLLERVGEIEGTKEVIEQAHKKMVAGKYRIATPSSIQTAAINIINGADGVKSHSDYRPLWNQVVAEIKKNGRRSTHQWNGQIAPVLKKAGGYTRLCSLSTYDAEQTFKSAFQDTI